MCHNWGATARAHVQGSFPDLENIWYSDGDQLIGWRAKVNWDLLCTCARAGRRFQISRTAGPIVFKFGTRIGTEPLSRVPCKSIGNTPRSSARAGLNLSLARSSPPKGGLLVVKVIGSMATLRLERRGCYC